MAFKRTPFSPAGPFLARKNFSIFETQIEVDKTYGAEVFARMHERRVEQLWNAKYIDMAEAGAKALGLADVGAADPLDRDGNGDRGGSLTEAEQAALIQAGYTVDEWLKLPEPERTTALADALKAAAPSGPVEGDNGGATGPEGGGGEAAAKPVAYRHSGFGRYFAVDAEGKQFGDKLTKAEAAGFAARDGVPLLGLMDALPGA